MLKYPSNSNEIFSAFDSLPSHICILDSNGVIIAVNKTWKNFGKKNNYNPLTSNIGVNYINVCKKSDDSISKKIAKELVELLHNKRNLIEIEYPCHSNNVKRWFLMKAKLFKLEKNKYIVISHEDITSLNILHSKIESIKRKNEIKYKSLVSALHEGIVLIDSNGKIQAFNKSAEEILDISLQDVVDNKLKKIKFTVIDESFKIVPPSQQPGMKALNTGKSIDNVILGIKNKDQIKWVSVNAQPIFLNGSIPSAVVISFNDITEQKKSDEALKYLNTQLERSNSELLDFASVASHDLQEPLRKIQAFSDRIIVKYSTILPDEGKDYLHRMNNAANRMQKLINDLLTYSRVSTKPLPFIKVDLNQIVEDVLLDLEVAIEESNTSVIIEKLPVIQADEVQMRQLFQNLIGNALKFHSITKKPKIIVESKSDKERVGSIDKFCHITIKDNGIGFEQKYASKIFNVFQRLHTSSEYTGTGVGLAVCRKIVERHKGKISAKSSPNVGTTFTITLPLKHDKEVKTTDESRTNQYLIS